MGNVQQRGKADRLTKFQREKLKYDFYTFFDLNNDGCLTYKDFLWAKDKICYMSGWKIDSPKYKITEALFNEIWESLEILADVDKDGKITKTEWLKMWTSYKKEIMDKEKEGKEFLKLYYENEHIQHSGPNDSPNGLETSSDTTEIVGESNNNNYEETNLVRDEDDWPVQLDSDEEPMSVHLQNTKEDMTMEISADNGQKSPEESLKTASDEMTKAKDSLSNGLNSSISLKASENNIADSTILEQFAADKTNFVENTKLPKWLYKYLLFRFNLLDRTGDGIIDHEEFEYVLSEFGVSERVARQAFTIFTQNDTLELDFDYFVQLFEEYYLSDDPSDLGNFINGKLEFGDLESSDEEPENEPDPGLLDHRINSSTSIHSMDDDLRLDGDDCPKSKKKKN